MIPRKLKVRLALFCYAGNGMYSSIHPSIAGWLASSLAELSADQRVEGVDHVIYSDTPITMTRNLAVVEARRDKVDVLVMVDSDQQPDWHLDRPGSKPFISSSFNFLYERYQRGPHVVMAPYCGGPPQQVVFVFQWANWTDEHPDQDMRLVKYGRKEASQLGGIQECAAGPTGLSMFDMRIFDVTEPPDTDDEERWKGWFYYEYRDKYACQKGSTEDVTATRDMSLIGCRELGYNPVYCNWDAWAGHWKPLCVGKPIPIASQQVSRRFRDGAVNGINRNEQLLMMGDDDDEPTPTIVSPPFNDLSVAVNSPLDLECLRGLVKRAALGKSEAARVVEVGTWLGKTAITMADAGAEVTCVDVWRDFDSDADIMSSLYRANGERVYNTFLSNIGTRKGRSIFPLRMTSVEAALEIKEPVDMVFIDANHEYEAVKADIQTWLPKVRDGGILCGHDYDEAFSGVIDAVKELLGGVNVTGSVWWCYVSKSSPSNQSHGSEKLGSEPWQTSQELLESFGFTPQVDLRVIRNLVQKLNHTLGREPLVVELGTFIGQSTKAMAHAGAKVISIDNLEGSPNDSTLVYYGLCGKEAIQKVRAENLGSMVGSSVHFVIGDSVKVGKAWKKPIDMVYIDANHDYEPTRNDIQTWLPHVREGGIIAGHDYDPQFPGVIRAVTELFPEGVNVEGQVWWTVKKSSPVNRLAPLPYPEFDEDVPEAITNGYAR